ncbi:kinase-like protein, partial [Gyrodon lividus]
GQVYHAIDIIDQQDVVMKLEAADDTKSALANEYRILTYLDGGVGIPRAYWHGHEANHKVLVLQYLGPSLGEVFKKCGRKFTLNTVSLLVDQLLTWLELVHSLHYVHCDIKPHNILTSMDEPGTVYLADFGLAMLYRDPNTRAHVHFHKSLCYTGTPAFSSINSHLGRQLSQRDNIQSLAYTLIYMLRGYLPWQLAAFKTDSEVLCMKQSITSDVLCHQLPKESKTFLDYSQSLTFYQKPDYDYLRQLIRGLHAHLDGDDTSFDWQLSSVSSSLQ